jgi:ribosomal protein S18 acetylase RimI-like enzyme
VTTTPDIANVSIREAKQGDAAALIAHLKALVAEPGINIPLAPDEVTMTVEQEKAILADFETSPRAIMFVADAGDEGIVGELSIKAISSRKAVQHVATLGMSVKHGWRGKGIGRQLMAAALEWAPTAGIKRIELYVYERNEPAIELYKSFGFEIEGKRKQFIREGDGFLDDYVMARLL